MLQQALPALGLRRTSLFGALGLQSLWMQHRLQYMKSSLVPADAMRSSTDCVDFLLTGMNGGVVSTLIRWIWVTVRKARLFEGVHVVVFSNLMTDGRGPSVNI